MPRLADLIEGRARAESYVITAAPSAVEVRVQRQPRRARRRFEGPKLSKEELTDLRTAFGPLLSLEQAAHHAHLSPNTLKKQLSQGKFRDCVKRGKPLLFITERFFRELFRGAGK